MKCREYIDKIVEDNGDMEALSDILCESMSLLDDDNYDKMCNKLYVLAYGEQLNEDMARNFVESMMPYGEHWSMEQTTSVGNAYGWDKYSKESFYYVMNMMYNDYHSLFAEDTNMYTKLSRSFLIDEDAPNGNKKAYIYANAMKM